MIIDTVYCIDELTMKSSRINRIYIGKTKDAFQSGDMGRKNTIKHNNLVKISYLLAISLHFL